jgi:S1-C subfamily serine protease
MRFAISKSSPTLTSFTGERVYHGHFLPFLGKLVWMSFRFLFLWCGAAVWLGCTPSHATEIVGPDFADLSEAVLPTTVHIRVERGALISAGIQQMARDYALPVPRGESQSVQQSTGSGVIFDHRGLILTNHHVINGAQSIRVTLYDQRAFEAVLLGADPRTDVAVLKIKGDGPFDAASIGDSDILRVGQWVVAVGHPFDFPFTVTSGIVSALGRRSLGRNEIQDYIQTDVAVNPGSSGGPLFNTNGLVVGINTAIFSPDKENLANAGISFAIPSRMAMRIATQLASTGGVNYAGIGITTKDAPATQADPRPGAQVEQVLAGGPADNAGLRRGDVIITVDGEPIPNSKSFRALILSKAIGAKLTITHKRGSKTRLIKVKTANAASIGPSAFSPVQGAKSWAGMQLIDASAKRLTQRGIALPKNSTSGVLDTSVEPDSPADLAGIMPGDVLLQVQKTILIGVDDLLTTVENREVVMVSFWRGQNRYLAALANRVQPG